MGGRRHGGVLPRRANSLYRAEGADTENLRAASASCPSHRGEEGQERSSVAAGLSEHAAHEFRTRRWQRRSLECALTLRPNHWASLQCAFQRQHQPQKGDISNKLTMGTFLISLDNRLEIGLTAPKPGVMLLASLRSPARARSYYWAPIRQRRSRHGTQTYCRCLRARRCRAVDRNFCSFNRNCCAGTENRTVATG